MGIAIKIGLAPTLLTHGLLVRRHAVRRLEPPDMTASDGARLGTTNHGR